MKSRIKHQNEVQAFLRAQFPGSSLKLTLPHGHGNESYFAHGERQGYFVKLNAPIAVYQAVAEISLTPPVLARGYTEDGTSILVQPYIHGRTPSQKDFHTYLSQIANIVDKLHRSPEVKKALPPPSSTNSSELASQALDHLRTRWELYKMLVPSVAGLVDESLASLEQQCKFLQGSEVAASHNDICNANWLITPQGGIYLIDLDVVSHDDPACDIGAVLWWYYPPQLRRQFLEIVGFSNDEAFRKRMEIRMAIHCLNIKLPREHSFDRFLPTRFSESLTDFLAVISGKENPQGYNN